MSNDLWLLQIIKEDNILKSHDFNDLLTDVKFDNYNKTYTKEVTEIGMDGAINNVYDAYVRLKELVTIEDNKTYQKYYKNKLGDLHIYSDGTAMEYTADVNNFDV